jgi:hypothetical protein
MTITKELLAALNEAMNGREYLCIDYEPSKYGLGGTFIKVTDDHWDHRFHPLSIWPEKKFRYQLATVCIGPRRNKRTLRVLISDTVDRRDLRQLQRAYVESL